MKKTKLMIALGALLILSGGTYVANQVQPDRTGDSQSVTASQVETAQSLDMIRFTADSTSSVLEQLQSKNRTVVTVTSDQGSYIDSINGLKGGIDGKYWTYYVDGQMASVGADQYIPKGGEVIEWKFQKL